MEWSAEVKRQTEFSITCYKSMVDDNMEGNVSASPLSISLMLAMVAAGATGESREQFCESLMLPTGDLMHDFAETMLQDVFVEHHHGHHHSIFQHHQRSQHQHKHHPHGPLQTFSTGIWLDKEVPIKASFHQLLKDKYLNEVQTMDFHQKCCLATTMLSQGVDGSGQSDRDRSRSRTSISGRVQGLILTNTIHFRGKWKEPFHEWESRPHNFHLLNGHAVKVPMMISKKVRSIGTFDHCKVLKLPYHDDAHDRALCMYIILPDARYGLLRLESKLNAELLQKFLQCVQPTQVGEFKLPRFRIFSPALDVRDLLQSLGLVLPFAPGTADFSELVEGADCKLHISTVLHQAFVEVNEGETKTSAVANTLLAIMHIHHHHHHQEVTQEQDFVADHPFLFVIKDDHTDAVLFIGRVTDPSVENHSLHNSLLLPAPSAHGPSPGPRAHISSHHSREKHHWFSGLTKHMHFSTNVIA